MIRRRELCGADASTKVQLHPNDVLQLSFQNSKEAQSSFPSREIKCKSPLAVILLMVQMFITLNVTPVNYVPVFNIMEENQDG